MWELVDDCYLYGTPTDGIGIYEDVDRFIANIVKNNNYLGVYSYSTLETAKQESLCLLNNAG